MITAIGITFGIVLGIAAIAAVVALWLLAQEFNH